jgi:hypothetical protein
MRAEYLARTFAADLRQAGPFGSHRVGSGESPRDSFQKKVINSMKQLRILIYTDTLGLDDEKDSFCISDLRRFLPLKLGHIVEVKTDTLVRHFDDKTNKPRHAANKLTHDLLEQYHELWVFGFDNRKDTGAEPQLLLTPEEVAELARWMKTGGVMVTGDHSEGETADACRDPNHAEFRARGYSLGFKIPRAGQLRVWEGPPTNCTLPETPLEESDNYNTQEPSGCSADLNDACLERDDHPQTLEPEPYPPHFLFFYGLDAGGRRVAITQFPDHPHVGKVVETPKVLDEHWPPHPTVPRVVARGRDKRFTAEDKIYNLVVAYDGDEAGVGRIVSDASFHHFLNINIGGPPSRAIGMPERDSAKNPKPGTPLDKMAQFYANLAYWLAPKDLRQEIKKELLFRAARHIDVLETFGNGASRLGKAARSALKSLLGEADLLRVVESVADGGEGLMEGDPLAYALAGRVGRGGREDFSMLGDEHLLGSIIESYYGYFREKGMNLLTVTEDVVPREVISNTFVGALRAQASRAEVMLARLAAGPSPSPTDDASPDAPGGEGEDGGL